MDYRDSIKSILESLLLAASEPLSLNRLSDIIGADEHELQGALDELEAKYGEQNKGIQIRQVAGGYGFYTNPENRFYVDRLLKGTSSRRLTQAALEVMAIVVYRQPVTRVEINNIRGVNSETVLNSLVEKGLIKEKGRDKTPGMPILYETTTAFLETIGLNDLEELPDLDEFAPDKSTSDQIREQLTSSFSDDAQPNLGVKEH